MKAARDIHLVEDDEMVRLVGADALEDPGYEVMDARSADGTIAILETVSEVQLLFTDIRMPGSVDGLALAKLVHDRWPAMKILVTSGDTWPSKELPPDDGRFLAKPYKLERLQGEVDDILE